MSDIIKSPCTDQIKKILEMHGHTNVKSTFIKESDNNQSTCCGGGKFVVSSDQLKEEKEVGETLGQSIVTIGKLIGKL